MLEWAGQGVHSIQAVAAILTSVDKKLDTIHNAITHNHSQLMGTISQGQLALPSSGQPLLALPPPPSTAVSSSASAIDIFDEGDTAAASSLDSVTIHQP